MITANIAAEAKANKENENPNDDTPVTTVKVQFDVSGTDVPTMERVVRQNPLFTSLYFSLILH